MQIQPLPQQTTYRPALRLIDTKSITHDEWLDVRKQGIGSSEIPPLCLVKIVLVMPPCTGAISWNP